MDNIDNGPTHTVLPHGNGSEHFKDILTPDNDTENENHRHCVSLPLYYDQVGFLCVDFDPITWTSISHELCLPHVLCREKKCKNFTDNVKKYHAAKLFRKICFFYHPFPTNSF